MTILFYIWIVGIVIYHFMCTGPNRTFINTSSNSFVDFVETLLWPISVVAILAARFDFDHDNFDDFDYDFDIDD